MYIYTPTPEIIYRGTVFHTKKTNPLQSTKAPQLQVVSDLKLRDFNKAYSPPLPLSLPLFLSFLHLPHRTHTNMDSTHTN